MTTAAVDKPGTPKVLLVTSNWWPLSARLAMALLRHGCKVAALCPPGHPLRYVTESRGRLLELARLLGIRKWLVPEAVDFTPARGIVFGNTIAPDQCRESAIAPD
jgi:hypothetical protein